MTAPAGGIRPARASDLPVLQEIERAAGSLFAPLGMDLVAEDDPPAIATLADYQREGRAWVRPTRTTARSPTCSPTWSTAAPTWSR